MTISIKLLKAKVFPLKLFVLFIVTIAFNSCSVHNKFIVDSDTKLKSQLGLLQPGDTLIIKEGIYKLELFANIPSGKNWEQPIVIKAMKGSKVIFRPNSGSRVLHFGKYYMNQISVHHIEISGLILDAQNVKSDVVKITDGAHHIRIKDCEIKNSKNQGILIPHKDSDYNEIIGCEIHSNGIDDFRHGIYISSDNNLVDSCHIYNNAGCGVNIFNGKGTSNYNIVQNSHIHNNAAAGKRGTGINLHSGKGHIARNNIIHDNRNGIQVKYNSVECYVENNLIYNIAGYSIVLGNGSTDCVARNNTIVKNLQKRNPEVLIGQKANRPQMIHTIYKTDLTNISSRVINKRHVFKIIKN